jgi:hypothetical protein
MHGPAGSPASAATQFEDLSDAYGSWFDEYGCTAAVLVRPDWYVYGVARSPQGVAELVDGLVSTLRVH